MFQGMGSRNFLTQEALSWNIALLKDNLVSTTADTPFPLCPFLRPFLDVRPHWLLVSHRPVTLSMCFPPYKEGPGQSHHWPPGLPANFAAEQVYGIFPSQTLSENWLGPKKLLCCFFAVGVWFLYFKVNCRLTMNLPSYYEHHTLLCLFLKTICEVDTGCLSLISRFRTRGPESSKAGQGRTWILASLIPEIRL